MFDKKNCVEMLLYVNIDFGSISVSPWLIFFLFLEINNDKIVFGNFVLHAMLVYKSIHTK